MSGLVESVAAALEQMPWLTPADQGAVNLARSYAQRIDEALETGEGQEVTKALYLGPHLLRCLETLGGTPTGRKALELREVVGGKLAAVREISQPEKQGRKRKPA